MISKRFNSLFVQAVVVLIFISIIPVFIIGFHVLGVDSRILKNEILQKQQSVARRILAMTRSNLTYQEQLLAVFLDLHAGGPASFTEKDLDHLRQITPSFLQVATLDMNGALLVSTGHSLKESLQEVTQNMLATCSQHKPYISDIFRSDDHMFVWLAEPYQKGEEEISGVLAVAYDLQEMGKSLEQSYPSDMEVALVSASGELISYGGALPESLSNSGQMIAQRIQQIDSLLDGKKEGEISLPKYGQILVSVATWSAMNWSVYVNQPANLTAQLLKENFSWDMIVLLLTMFFFIFIVSYWVLLPITRPLGRLRKAAIRLRDEEDVELSRQDVDIPNNEIGELALIVVEMSKELQGRRRTLIKARAQLAQSNQILEKRVEERTMALKKATHELIKTERLAAIGQMASIISHEIRNPLAVISNATRLIKMLVRTPDPKVTKQFGIIESEIRQANSIISEVLGYARSRELILTSVDLTSYIKDILMSYPFGPGITLVEDFAQEGAHIKVDVEEIKQAIRNIISNAVEAMAGQGMLTVRTRVGKRVVEISIADTGPGISEEVRQKMFSPFFTTKARGTGLGLAVVGKAMQRHKGKIFITSEIGKGTTFHLYLKIYRKLGDTDYGEAS